MSEKNILDELYEIVELRKQEPMEGSYTNYLLDKGLDKILKKVGEETSEVIIASKNEDKSEMVLEISDLIYHLIVLMSYKGVKVEEIVSELEKRRSKIRNKKEPNPAICGIH